MSDQTIDVIKRGNKRPAETFDPGKLYASIYATCVSVKSLDGLADDAARRVCDAVLAWSYNKAEVTSADIRRRAAKALSTFHPDAAYIYKHYQHII